MVNALFAMPDFRGERETVSVVTTLFCLASSTNEWRMGFNLTKQARRTGTV